ncbi:MAG: SoxR reducing system RseC family protein [Lutibacter sp.]|uniref:SoxR reducing system RseC family protein n=1 Tax=Lutibacter sp. TaxID=1925666 RepID=UPI0017E4A41C|nr:SoxR reducing system RseC family protein [Lutibacter sp.]MBT8318413.1 SoxR reducing system RseC family protein [Lutibacter sp.]NNJ59271.1 SoxR reducing system RseC family protein [Lutibacter sp.]
MMKKSDNESNKGVNNFEIEHEGYISKITNQVITVSLKGNVNCEGCKAQSACGTAEAGDKEIEIVNNVEGFKLNDAVDVVLEKNVGLKAVFWAYIFPFILIIGSLIITTNFFKEWVAGLVSLFILVPYYLMLFILKDTFQKAFRISIFKNN